MTFQEFFKKKKINLALLNSAEPDLFAEFESHYQLMGEKSFDHTKKYWFNTLRRKYHLPDEPKVEKVIIENKIAEQTITESIIEQAEVPVPKIGFKPKFKAAVTAPVNTESTPVTQIENIEPEITEVPAPKLGFKPKFKMDTTVTTPAEKTPNTPKVEPEPQATEVAFPKLGFKPKFKAGVTKQAEQTTAKPDDAPLEVEPSKSIPSEADNIKPSYKPKFKAAHFKPKPEDSE